MTKAENESTYKIHTNKLAQDEEDLSDLRMNPIYTQPATND